MSDEIFFDGQRFVSAGQASLTADLTRDYIARLCRDGKVRGRRIGKNWYVHEDSLRRFIVEQRYVKQQRREQLSSARTKEYVVANGSHIVASASGPSHRDSTFNDEASLSRQIRPVSVMSSRASNIHTQLKSKALSHGERAMRYAPSVLVSPSGAHEAIARTIGHSAMHVPVYTVTPFAEFLQKFFALVIAFTMTFGTYAFVDPTYARFAMGSIGENIASISDAYVAVTGGGIESLAERTRTNVSFAAENPRAALAQVSGAGLSLFPEALRSIARAVNTRIDDFVYAIAFPNSITGSLALSTQDNGGSQVAPYARGPQKSSGSTNSAVAATTSSGASGLSVAQNPVTVIERIIETERVVSQAGGISEDYLNQRLAALETTLSGRLLGASQGGGGYTTINNNYQMIAQTNNIDKLGSVTIENSTFTGGTISDSSLSDVTITGSSFAGSVAATTLSASATSSLATTTITGDLDVSGSLTVGSLSLSSASTTDLIFDRATGTSATTTNFFSTNASTTNATSTNLFSVVGRFTSGIIDTLTSTLATITGLTVTYSTTTNATTTNGYVANLNAESATTTSLFSTTASSTNLFSSVAQFGSLSVLGALTQTGLGTFANGFLSQASSTVVGAFTNTGAATFGSTLAASGLVTLSSGFISNASSTVVGNFTSTGTGAFSALSAGSLALTGGLTAYASSTIGDGTQVGGLTISGGATTTGDFVISKASAPTTGSIYFGNGTANLNYNSSDFTLTGGNLFTAAGRITAVGLNETIGLGVRYVSGDGTYYVGATHSATPDLVFTNNGLLERARITDSGNFGIGTTSPWAKLAISANNGETNRRLFDISSSTASATTSLFTVLNSGNVGIGTTTPGAKLEINGGTSVINALLSNNGYLEWRSSTGATGQIGIYGQTNNGLAFYTGANNRLTISSAGNVGIGTSSPLSKLHVESTAGGTRLELLRLSRDYDGASAEGAIGFYDSNHEFAADIASVREGSSTNWGLKFSTGSGDSSSGPTERFRIDSSGNVGIGTTTPWKMLSVAGDIIGTNITATGTIAAVNGAFTGTSGTTTIAAGQGLTIGSTKFVVQENSGNIGIGTAAPTTGLDIGVTTRVTGDLSIAGGSALTISASGPVNQTGTGQVTFAGNVDATNGLDVTNANFTVGGSNFTVAQATGNTSIAGTLGLTGALNASSTVQSTGAARFYSTLRADGAATFAAAGTGLSVTNDASIGGTLGLTGAATFGSTLSVSGLLSAATSTFTGNVALSGKKITGLGSPTADEDAANKTYVDSVAQGLSLKDSVAAGTTANITLSGEQTIDGVSLSAGDRVLVKDQTDQTKNGIYVVAVGSWSRATDADENSEVSSGMFTFIADGTTNASSGWVLTTTGAITLGTTLLSFTQFSGAGQIIAGTGITKSSNTLNVIGTADRITANADSIDIASTYVGQSSITTVGALTSGSIGSGFGNINIGASSITGGVATFSSIVGSAINGTGDLSISGSGTFSNGLTVVGTLSAATTTFSGNVALGGKKITGLADPTSAQEAATKAYVDAIAQGLTVKSAVKVATSSNITLSGTQTVDGVSLSAGDRVLVMGQSTASQNGIYTVAAGAWSRSSDADENSEVATGMYAFVQEGTAYANTGWSLITLGAITLDTTSLSFTQFSGSAETTAGDGLVKSGNTISVVGTAGRITVSADSIDIASTYTGQSSIVTVGTLTSGAIGSGFGAINIGSNALTAGAATLASATSFGSLLVGGTATTTISGNSATSTFSGGISLAGGNVNLATGGNFLINNILALNATTLGSSVVNSSLTSVGALDSGSITTGFGAINIGADTLDAGNTTLANLSVTGSATTSQLAASSLTSGRVPFLTTGGRLIDSSALTFDTALSRLTATYASTTALTVSGSTILANATTTALFSTTASSTNLFSSAAQFGSLSVLGALTQTGLGTFANGFLSQASSTVVGAFTNTGAATFGSTLAASGLATLSSGFLSQASSTVSGAFTATGATSLGSTLAVSGASNFTGLLSSTNASTSLLSVFNKAYFGGTATSTFDSTGFLSLPNGFLSQASSTIGSGTQAGGLTISGGATTTGNAYFAGNVGVGTSSPWAKLAIHANNGETNTTLFSIASSTASATTTLFSVSNAGLASVGTSITFNGSTGAISTQGSVSANGGNGFQFTGRSILTSAADGVIALTNNAVTDFSRLQLGGTTASFPAIKRNGAGIDFRLADDSGYATTTAQGGIFNGLVGIGTTTPGARLDVQGAGSGTGILARYVNSAYTAVMSVLDNGTAYFLGNLGVGTSTPTRKLSVTDTVAAAQVAFAYDATRWAQFRVDSAGDLNIEASGGDTYFNNDNFWVCTGGSIEVAGCPSGTPTGQGNIIVENKIGVGTTTPVYKLGIETQDSSTGFFHIASSTNQAIFTIGPSGKVGIGTASPTARLEVGAGGSINTTENALSDGATIAVDWLQGNQQKVTLGGNRTITFSNYAAGAILRLVVCQDATGSRTLTWPSVVLWASDTAPTLSTTANTCDLVTFVGTNGTSTLTVFGAAATGF